MWAGTPSWDCVFSPCVSIFGFCSVTFRFPDSGNTIYFDVLPAIYLEVYLVLERSVQFWGISFSVVSIIIVLLLRFVASVVVYVILVLVSLSCVGERLKKYDVKNSTLNTPGVRASAEREYRRKFIDPNRNDPVFSIWLLMLGMRSGPSLTCKVFVSCSRSVILQFACLFKVAPLFFGGLTRLRKVSPSWTYKSITAATNRASCGTPSRLRSSRWVSV